VPASCDKEGAVRMATKEDNNRKTLQAATWPFAPFLLTTVLKDGGKREFVIDKWEGSTIDIDKSNQFTQTFTWIGHKASEEEVAKFMKEEE
jgi:hypothetical protein